MNGGPRYEVIESGALIERHNGIVVKRWDAPSMAAARRGLALLEMMQTLAALDVSGTNRGRSDLPAFGCIDITRASPSAALTGASASLRTTLMDVHRAGFTAVVGCRYHVLVERDSRNTR